MRTILFCAGLPAVLVGMLTAGCGSSSSDTPADAGGSPAAAGSGGSGGAQGGAAAGGASMKGGSGGASGAPGKGGAAGAHAGSGGAGHGGAGKSGAGGGPGGAGTSGAPGVGGAGSPAGTGGTAAAGASGASGASGAQTGGMSGASGSDAGGAGGAGAASGVGGAGAASGAAGSTQQSPTVSSWLGTNVAADLPRVDITYQLNAFDTPAAQKDPQGYPSAGSSGKSDTDIGFILPTGSYKISYKGDGALSVSGVGQLMGGFQAAGGEQRGVLQITGTPGSFGHSLTLQVTNGPGQTVTDIRILSPGFDYDTPQLFQPPFLGLLTPFRALRFMDWESTNNSSLAQWSDRPTSSSFGHSPQGEPYEHIAGLVNETGKDCWVTIPELASDDFIHQFAKFLAQSLDFAKIDAARAQQGQKAPFQLILEDSNETWNPGFSANKTFLAAANADAARYPGTYAGTYGPSWMSGNSDLMKVAQYHADRLAKSAAIFRQEFMAVNKSEVIAPVLSGWALGAVYSDAGLRFIKDNYGDPKTQISYVALAPYFGPDEGQTGDLGSLFASANTNIQSMDAALKDFAKLSADYGIAIAAYEGGQSITGTNNQPIKHLAQHDKRMYDAYTAYYALWRKDLGDALFMHFTLAGTPGIPELIYQYGYWGSIAGALEDTTACGQNLPVLTGTESIDSVVHHCPKYRALQDQAPL